MILLCSETPANSCEDATARADNATSSELLQSPGEIGSFSPFPLSFPRLDLSQETAITEETQSARPLQSSSSLFDRMSHQIGDMVSRAIASDPPASRGIELGADATAVPPTSLASSLPRDSYGFPLSIFTQVRSLPLSCPYADAFPIQGNLFHPYLSISYLDMIRSRSVRGYVIGVTNALFKHRTDIVDVIVTVRRARDPQWHERHLPSPLLF
jgi:hypothetical protein